LYWWLASIRDAQAQLHTGHQDIRTYFSNMIEADPTTTPIVITTALTITTALPQNIFHYSPYTQLATISTDICWFFPWCSGGS
jgi:hypothetical protein